MELKEYLEMVERKLLPKLNRIEFEIKSLKEELEILKNPTLVGKIQKSLEDKKKGKLYSWEDFKKVVKGK
ncbi:MAG: hypothetical protein ACP5F8_03240 [Candidatus Aenigmatarchaeota archaeon]|jgi:hypothetical protein